MISFLCLLVGALLAKAQEYDFGAHLGGEELCWRLRNYRDNNLGKVGNPNVQNIDFSQALFKTAELHALHLKQVDDGSAELPQPSCDPLLSWAEGPTNGLSDTRVWESCCVTASSAFPSCMQAKPQEITTLWQQYQFVGNAFEMTYKTGDGDIDTAYNYFIYNAKATEMLFNDGGTFQSFSWVSMGCAWNSPFASVWFSDSPDAFVNPSYQSGGALPVSYAPPTPAPPSNTPAIAAGSTGGIIVIAAVAALLVYYFKYVRKPSSNDKKDKKKPSPSVAMGVTNDSYSQQYYQAASYGAQQYPSAVQASGYTGASITSGGYGQGGSYSGGYPQQTGAGHSGGSYAHPQQYAY